MPQLDKFTYFTQLFTDTSIFFIYVLSVLLGIFLMEVGDASGKRKQLPSSSQRSSLTLAGFGGSDDGQDPNKRRRMPVTKGCIQSGIAVIRNLISEILVDSPQDNLASPDTQRLNSAINSALPDDFSRNRRRRNCHIARCSSWVKAGSTIPDC